MRTEQLCLSMAGIDFAMEITHPEIRDFCRGYLTDRPPRFVLRTTEEEFLIQAAQLPECTPAYWEFICLQRALARELPLYDGFFLHGGALAMDGRAYLFLGPSGRGKTTHLGLWQQRFGGRVRIVNGDKPILRQDGEGFTVWGDPWQGRERLGENMRAPVAGLCFLERGAENRGTAISPAQALPRMVKQVFFPEERERRERFLALLDRLLTRTPCYVLECDMSLGAAEASYAMLTGTLPPSP